MIEFSSTPLILDEQLERESYWQKKWKGNQGLCLILLSQLFGALMITSARLLQNGTAERPGNMLTLQVRFFLFFPPANCIYVGLKLCTSLDI